MAWLIFLVVVAAASYWAYKTKPWVSKADSNSLGVTGGVGKPSDSSNTKPK